MYSPQIQLHIYTKNEKSLIFTLTIYQHVIHMTLQLFMWIDRQKHSDQRGDQSSSSDNNCPFSFINYQKQKQTNDTTNYLTASRCLQASFGNNSGSVPKVILTMVNILYSAQFADISLIRCTQFRVWKCSLQLYYHSSAANNMIQN